jgi:hypothetical protein
MASRPRIQQSSTCSNIHTQRQENFNAIACTQSEGNVRKTATFPLMFTSFEHPHTENKSVFIYVYRNGIEQDTVCIFTPGRFQCSAH